MRILAGLLSFVLFGTMAADACDSSILEGQIEKIVDHLGNVGVGVQFVETGEQLEQLSSAQSLPPASSQ